MKNWWRQKNKKIIRDEESTTLEKENEVNIKVIRKLEKEKKTIKENEEKGWDTRQNQDSLV